MRGSRLILSALALVVLQLGFLSWIILGRAAVLRNGQEIVLKAMPFDPRDLLRGDYVRLSFPVSTLPASMVANPPAEGTAIGDETVYVRVRRGEDGYWQASGASLGKRAGPAPGEVELRGTVSSGRSFEAAGSVPVEYGIERFYVPEGQGLDLQNDMRERSFGLKVAVGSDGAAQTKALLDGERTVYAEPLY